MGTGWGERQPGTQMQDMVAQKGGMFVPAVSPAIKARDYKEPSSDGDGDGDGAPLIADAVSSSVAHALRGEGHDASEDGTGRGTPIIAIQGAATRENPESGPDGIGVRTDGAAYTLEARAEVQAVSYRTAGALAAEPGVKQQTYVQQGWAVRRLTPLECTRLQGFPNDYFDVPTNKPFADGPVYKMLGNSMAVNVMRWIGERIAQVEAFP